MAATHVERRGVLYLVVCAVPPARDALVLVNLAEGAGWDVCVIATPSARGFIEIPTLEAATGHPVRSDYKRPDDPDVLPPPDAIAVAPATFNTINKWVAGISDTLALGLLTEAIGKHLTVVALPFVNAAQAKHPAFQRSIEQLRKEGVRLRDRQPACSALPMAHDRRRARTTSRLVRNSSAYTSRPALRAAACGGRPRPATPPRTPGSSSYA